MKNSELNSKIKKIHFTGIKGVGMTPLAIIAKEAGFKITGSDVAEKFITDEELSEAGIKIFEGFSEKNIIDQDLVIATGAHGGSNNIEVVKALEKNIPVLNQGQALGIFQRGDILNKKNIGISVAGSHGKTTTTAILATILKENSLDPSYVIGTGKIPSLGASGHFGKGEYFITEADEYFSDIESDRVAKFMHQDPKIILVTNIDFDHPDVFPTFDELKKVYRSFIEKLPQDGLLVICGDGVKNREFKKTVNVSKVTYGFSPDNDYVIDKVGFDQEKMFFWVSSHGASLGQFSTRIFGEHNARNSLGALVVALEIGLSANQIKKGLSAFKGTKRRAEFIVKLKEGHLLYDDYAHHPEEIKETLSAFRSAFQKYNIVVIFQPHMYSRTKKLFDDFVISFDKADEIIITEIFPSFREPIDKNFSSKLIVDELNKRGKKAQYCEETKDVIKYLPSGSYPDNTILITMGAGDIYKVGQDIIDGSR
jgi:UDP-N-acetylmuramate--alanine ligase